ncbi:hypothetical protein BS47DRAFT_1351359 [Hydnum rufescens UP504]|uniref:Uncharacterized protein n=1 Tax=Hydnum rufescens UP504 TaxID=1448309 RepID=A0A9P6ALJ8_9AGAM|nr:hypothetical protein BS47DRAFT_1351359 [Hydnum rufescens UP504]
MVTVQDRLGLPFPIASPRSRFRTHREQSFGPKRTQVLLVHTSDPNPSGLSYVVWTLLRRVVVSMLSNLVCLEAKLPTAAASLRSGATRFCMIGKSTVSFKLNYAASPSRFGLDILDTVLIVPETVNAMILCWRILAMFAGTARIAHHR